MFREVLSRLSERIQTTRIRGSSEPGMKFAITLQHIATGENYHSLAIQFSVPHIISLLVKEVRKSNVEEFQTEVICTPTNAAEWKKLADRFYSRWQLSHCLGAIEG